MIVTLIGIAIFGFVALAIYATATQADERATIRASLRQLDDYKVENVRDQEMLAPLTQRVFVPVLGALTSLGRRFTPVGYVENTKKKLLITGKAQADDLDRFLAVRVLTILAIIPAIYFWYGFVALKGKTFYITLLLVIAALVLGPDAVLNRKKEERQQLIRRALPDILDLLTISVEAGLGFEQALDRTVKSVPGPLSDEFTRMLNETRAGSSRADAMRAIDDRTDVTEVRSFVLAILQADTFGVSIGRILRAQADEMRIKRRQEAQERAQKAPVKMLIPMVFCVFPALFVIILGPAAISLTRNFK
ncbi:MAG: type II secretion system F family protein [Acidimicrobiales bacterium]